MLIAIVTFKDRRRRPGIGIAILQQEADTVRAMPGCVRFQPLADPADHCLTALVQEWADQTAFAYYAVSPGFTEIGAMRLQAAGRCWSLPRSTRHLATFPAKRPAPSGPVSGPDPKCCSWTALRHPVRRTDTAQPLSADSQPWVGKFPLIVSGFDPVTSNFGNCITQI